MKNINAIIVHGAYGFPEENWFGWLKKELGSLKLECLVPHLPTPEGQDLNAWIKEFNHTVQHKINNDTLLIGHSLGAVFILRWLEQHPCSIASVILVGAFMGTVNNPKFDAINKSFFESEFNWSLIKSRCRQFTCYYGTEDIYVSKQQFYTIADNLGARKVIVSNAGHFNTVSGYEKFPHILEFIKHAQL